MQLKTALLSSAVVAALAVLAHSTAGSDTPSLKPAPTPGAANQGAGVAAPAFASTTSQQPGAQRPAFLLASDVGARPGSELVRASTSPAEADASPEADRARGLLESVASKEVHRVPADGFVARDVMVDRDGTEHVRMNRTYAGLRVIGGDLVVHSHNGEVKSISQGSNMRTFGRPALTPALSADQAKVEAGASFNGKVASMDAELVVFARGKAPTLAYEVNLQGDRADSQLPGALLYYIDANNGTLLQEDDQIHTAAASGTGKTLTLGNVGIVANSVFGSYQLTDPSRGSGQTKDANGQTSLYTYGTTFSDADNVWGNNTVSDRATVAADAHYGVAATWDYYKATHGRSGIFNNSKGVKSLVHFGTNLINAFWYNGTKTMYYGDGDSTRGYRPLVALDVAGHEMSHGVNSATANLGYYDIKDSGGLNEANSDIFGTLVEFSTNNPNDPGDYLIGEEIYINNPDGTLALRQMFKQDADGKSFSCYPAEGFVAEYTGKSEKYDPHNTSGVGNRFFYLLAEGAVTPAGFNYTPSQLVCDGNTSLTGIGRAKAGAIWYRALTQKFVDSTDYPQARAATLEAAAELYGSASAEYKAVAAAWAASGVN